MALDSPAPARRQGDGQRSIGQYLVLAIVAAIVIGPLLMLVRTSLLPEGRLPLETLEISFENFRAVLTDPDLPVLLANTAFYALGSVAIGTVIATALAWLAERTDMPGRFGIRLLMFTWMAVPPVILGFGWILLINPGSGILNVFWRALTGGDGPFTIYSIWAMIFITSFSVIPTAFVMIGGLFRNMDPQLENSGYVHGGSAGVVARRITLPLLTPGLLSVGIYVFIAVVQAFELPLIVGLTARIPVLSTRIYLLSSPDVGVPNYGLSAAFGIFLLVLATLFMGLYFRVVGAGERYRIVSGKGFRPRQTKLKRWTFPAMLVSGLFCLLMLLPIIVLLWTSFLRFYELPSLAALERVSFATYREVLGRSAVQGAIGNTVLLVLGASTITMVLASLTAWYSLRGSGWVARAIDVLSFSPLAIPPIVMAMAILLLYLRTPLYGSVLILIIGHVTIYIAFATRTIASALIQLNKELADAATISGAGFFTVLTRIVIPLIWPQALNGWLWVLAHSARDLTIPLLLMTNANAVMSTVMWTLWDVPNLPGAAALSVLLVLSLLLVIVPAQIFIARASAKSQ
ncbi:ABC transporter permease subunit [Corticibacterium sp. UT-5YL-CI-8]|nr:ABC transporter permease subunit [Tianweitania sp. UT-5YL-CI-8]